MTQAVEIYTLTSAFAASEDQDRGFLQPGKLADLVVLSRDILAETERDHLAKMKS